MSSLNQAARRFSSESSPDCCSSLITSSSVSWEKSSYQAPTARKYNVGIVFKRAAGRGRIARIDGLREWLREAGPWAVEEKLLREGTPRRNWKQTLLSDGHVIVRHPDWPEAQRLSFAAATGIKMYAE